MSRQCEPSQSEELEIEEAKAVLQSWQRASCTLAGLLATLHEVAPPCAPPQVQWQRVDIAQLQTEPAIRKAYRRALLALNHPDKAQSVVDRVRNQTIFDALRTACADPNAFVPGSTS